jgi:hypothetical protein
MIRSSAPYLFSLLMLLFMQGCGPGKLAPADYVRWVQNPGNGLVKEVITGVVGYEVQFRPAAFIIANEERAQTIAADKAAKRESELGSMYYFTCTLRSNDGTDVLQSNLIDQQQYYQRVNYLSLDAQQDFKLVQANDTIPCAMYQLENTYGATPHLRMLLAFSSKEISPKAGNLKLIYHDRIFTDRNLEFEFDEQKINNLPQLLTQ